MKILHISDLHFGYHDEHIIQKFKNFTRIENPDLIIVTGDLTHRAKTDQFKAAKEFIKDLPCKTLCIPGNHDVPLYRLYKRFFSPFSKYKNIMNLPKEISFENDLVNVIGLNSVNPKSVKKGKLTSLQLEHIDNYFSHENKWNILMFHHNISKIEDLHNPLHSSKDLIEIAKDRPIHIICTGHLHYSHVNPIDEKFPIIAHAGSLSCKRKNDNYNSFFSFDIDLKNLKITKHIYKEGSFIKDAYWEFSK
ncbi:metallophosphoesterase family protein [Francisella frigiditurris]|uniref:Calcineurin-like phosphoesterase family protein n=1 Tax=Francisella frigiditurris TaxID=1542390 RepID=A0A1J0KUB8_9GAMM|nr:metallophosphoesterase [Francisella frigiditurris]APC97283.1 calcineurin-like phosphoesterase family protein [Francisella frigiditurris]